MYLMLCPTVIFYENFNFSTMCRYAHTIIPFPLKPTEKNIFRAQYYTSNIQINFPQVYLLLHFNCDILNIIIFMAYILRETYITMEGITNNVIHLFLYSHKKIILKMLRLRNFNIIVLIIVHVI